MNPSAPASDLGLPVTPRVLVVDDDPALASLVAAHLGEWGLHSESAHTEDEMWSALDAPPDVMLLDVFLGPSDGSLLVAEVVRSYPGLPILMVTRSSDLEIAVRSMRNGAKDYILKPIDFTKLERAVRSALEWSTLQRQLADREDAALHETNGRSQGDREPVAPAASTNNRTGDRQGKAAETEATPEASAYLDRMIGQSPAMLRLRTIIHRAAPTNVPVLILGETGTGKELAARAVHAMSSRASGPFVAVNAAAVPHELIESELFGHEKGAFTGASERKIGFCERAHHGTLFLDEIGEMAPEVQSKLLRFLQDHEVQRVGAQKARSVDVRVVAATNVDPQEQITGGRLREDLYYRLRGVQLELPPLRERHGDIRLLARHFLEQANQEREEPLRFSAQALAALSAAAWPGNVRQLENSIREATILAASAEIGAEDLAADVYQSHLRGEALEQPQTAHPAPLADADLTQEQELERQRIGDALRSGASPEEIASDLRLSRATLYRRIKSYGLSRQR